MELDALHIVFGLKGPYNLYLLVSAYRTTSPYLLANPTKRPQLHVVCKPLVKLITEILRTGRAAEWKVVQCLNAIVEVHLFHLHHFSCSIRCKFRVPDPFSVRGTLEQLDGLESDSVDTAFDSCVIEWRNPTHVHNGSRHVHTVPLLGRNKRARQGTLHRFADCAISKTN
jgi:hypothetical protein